MARASSLLFTGGGNAKDRHVVALCSRLDTAVFSATPALRRENLARATVRALPPPHACAAPLALPLTTNTVALLSGFESVLEEPWMEVRII